MIRLASVLLLCFVALLCQVDGQSNNFWSFGLRGDDGFSESVTVNSTEQIMDVFRLPKDVLPVSYRLEVATDFDNFTYSGGVEIVVNATVAKTCRITMNAKDLRVTGVEVMDRKLNVSLDVAGYYLVDRNEQLVIELNDTQQCFISSRQYIVKLAFQGDLRADMSGYYKSSYKENNAVKWLAVTQFEPTYARMAFPCFDEPMYKTPFKISIMRRSDQISLSNMPLLYSTKIQSNLYWDHFHESPPMSTYLVAYFIGEFYAMKTLSIGVYTHESFINQAYYITNKSPKLLQAMENFTGVEYKMPKLDLLAIPDFSFGAMENWGLNTYRERLLLLSENSRTKTKEFITTVVQHELSHQWFGDLVTCAWWDYLWLNEGFATYFEYFATKMVEPDWRLEEVFVIEVHQVALEYDQTPTHPISGSVNTPAEIKAMFDDISYSKAGAVLRMLQYTVTENYFKAALHDYLEHNAYTAVTPKELWNELENVLYENNFDLGDNFTVTQFMKSWTEQAGYPLIKISKENDTFVITQEHFLINSSNEINTTNLWIVGLTYTTENRKDFNNVLPKIWLKERQMVLPNQTDSGWYIFNLQSIGFYRVDYDEDNWNALIDQLYKDCNAIHVLNRAQLIDDAFNLAAANRLNYTLALKLIQYLEDEDEVMPWYSAKNHLEHLGRRMRRNTNGYKYLNIFVRQLAGLIFNKTNNAVVNLNNTEHSKLTSWNSFSSWACKSNNENCIQLALFYFNMWLQGKEIPADIKDTAFCVGVKNGNQEVWNSILGVYMNSESTSDRQAAQFALACSTDPVQLSNYLEFMFNGNRGPIRPQDFRVIYQTLATTPQGITALIEFLSNKLDRILNEITNGKNLAATIYSLLASRVVLDDEILKLNNLRNNPSVPITLQQKFNSSFTVVEEYLNWFEIHNSKIEKWIKNYVVEHGLDYQPPVYNATTVSPPTTVKTTLQSSSAILNAQAFSFISQLIPLSLLIINVLYL